jgi:segregation and condensation protein B
VTPSSISGAIEALLLVSGEPAPLERLRQSLGCTGDELATALDGLESALSNRGIRLMRGRDGIQLITAPEHAGVVERFLRVASASKPSTAALETLAIVAYHQPVNRAQIEEIRGVNCERVLRALAAQDLVQEVGRSSSLGRPVLYGTTDTFLHRFGLGSLAELPKLDIDADVSVLNASKTKAPGGREM